MLILYNLFILPALLKAMTKFKIDKNDFILDVGCGGEHIKFFSKENYILEYFNDSKK